MLLGLGALWNMMVMVFKAFTLFDLTARLAPSLHAEFERLGEAIGTRHERRKVAEAYRRIEPLNFSTGLLEHLPETAPNSLLTLPLQGVLWSDLGSPQRLANVLTRPDSFGRPRRVSAPSPWANRESASRAKTKTKTDRITLQMS